MLWSRVKILIGIIAQISCENFVKKSIFLTFEDDFLKSFIIRESVKNNILKIVKNNILKIVKFNILKTVKFNILKIVKFNILKTV